MAVEEQISRTTYKGNGVTREFPFTWDLEAEEYVTVKLTNAETEEVTTLELGTDYDVIPDSEEFPTKGGTIVYPKGEVKPAITDVFRLTIMRSVPYVQSLVFPENTRLVPKNIERGLDNLEYQIQQLNDSVGQCVALPPGVDYTGEELLDRIYEASREAQSSATNAEKSAGEAKQSADEALESAQKADTALKSVNIKTFASVAEMKASNTLTVGCLITTQGFNISGDSGGSLYVTVDDIDGVEVDEVNIIELKNNLYAKKLNTVDLSNTTRFTIGVNNKWEDFDDTLLEKLKEIGVKYIRIGVTWSAVEQEKGVYDFDSIFSSIAKKLKEYDFVPYVILGYNNTIYASSANSGVTTDENRIAFANYAKATVEYFKSQGLQNAFYEVWNEPNLDSFWNTPDAEKYTLLVKATYTKIKEADASANVVGGALSTDTNWGNRNLWGIFYRRCFSYGIADYVDYISLHFYTSSVPEEYDKYIWRYKSTISKYTNKDIKIIISETGYSTYTSEGGNGTASEEERKKYIPRMILNNLKNSIDMNIIFEAKDSYTDSNVENYFGLLKKDGNSYIETDTFTELKKVNEELNGYSFVKPILKTSTSLVLLFVKNYRFKIAYWSTQNNEVITIGKYTLQVTDTPQFLDVDIALLAYNSYSDVLGTNLITGDLMRNSANGDYNISSGTNVNIEGISNICVGFDSSINGSNSASFGQNNTVNKNYCLASGYGNIIKGDNSVCLGNSNQASGSFSQSCGQQNINSGYCSSAFGFGGNVSGSYCFASGQNLNANINNLAVLGLFNKSGATNDLFIIGNGSSSLRSNAFRVTKSGSVYGQSAYNSTGADYAEFFEWLDGNTESEDRTGYFVTLEGDKIKKATNNDSYILGVISVNPSLVGNSYDDQWQGAYIRDEWGRVITDDNNTPIVNPQYNINEAYVPRSKRKEWAIVGMLGVLTVRDDGSCIVNGCCYPDKNGIATKTNIGYRVIARITENTIKIVFK